MDNETRINGMGSTLHAHGEDYNEQEMRGLFERVPTKINAHNPPLQKLNEVIDWEMFRLPIELAFALEPKAPGGRPHFDHLILSVTSREYFI
ncbi:MAG: hypothetical protein MUP09_11135 [Thiovulaceae bacterium]|nr:hypothetical protein [Sulfurimonadaceae bacterium]